MADGLNIPEDLSELDEDALHQLQQDIAARAEGLRDDAATNDEALAELEKLATAADRIQGELAEREQARSERAERADSALSRISGGPADDTTTDPAEPDGGLGGGDGEGADEVRVPEPVAAATEGAATVEAAAETIQHAVGAEEVPSEPAAGAEAAAAAEATTETAAAADAAATAATEDTVAGTPETTTEIVEQLSEVRPAVYASGTEGSDDDTTTSPRINRFTEPVPVRHTGSVRGELRGQALDTRQVAELFCDKHNQMARLGGMTHEPLVIASARVEYPKDQMLGGSFQENFSVLQGIREDVESLVASGGNCAPLAPVYDIFRLAEPMSPVEDALPVVGADRGGIRYIQPPAFRDAEDGVRVTTEAQDAAGYTNQDPAGTTAPKPCVAVECPDVLESMVDAVSQCVTFGNLNYRTFPEQVEAFLQDLAVIFAETKETYYLDKIDAGSTSVNFTAPYGASRGVVHGILQAATGYRRRNHMPMDAPLDLLMPETVLPVLKIDMVNDLNLGLNFLSASMADVQRQVFESLGVRVSFYYDAATGVSLATQMKQAQSAGALNKFPVTFRAYLYAPGTWVRLDGGELNLGIVRDSTLNSQNDLQIFSEQWIQAVKVGIESVRLNLALCPSGVGPTPGTALTCTS